MSANQFISAGVVPLILLLSIAAPVPATENSQEAQWLRDPFRYPTHSVRGGTNDVSAIEEVSDTGLKGIFVSNGRYQALYNGQLVSPGQRAGKVLIHDISPYAITIEDGAGRRRIELFHEK